MVFHRKSPLFKHASNACRRTRSDKNQLNNQKSSSEHRTPTVKTQIHGCIFYGMFDGRAFPRMRVYLLLGAGNSFKKFNSEMSVFSTFTAHRVMCLSMEVPETYPPWELTYPRHKPARLRPSGSDRTKKSREKCCICGTINPKPVNVSGILEVFP